jgi:hypothetical protein
MSATIITQPDEITVGASYQDMTTDVLVEGIKKQSRRALVKGQEMVQAMAATGRMLIELKARNKHGTFLQHAVYATGLNERTIQRYMGMARGTSPMRTLKPRERSLGRKDPLPFIKATEFLIEDTKPDTVSLLPEPSPVPEVIEAEIVEPKAAQEMISVESLTGTSGETRSRVRAVNRAAEDFDPEDELPEPLADAIDRLIFILLTRKCSPEYIHGLCEGVLLTEKHNKQEGVKP